MIVKLLDRLSSKHYLVAILALLFVLDVSALWFAAIVDYDRTLERARIVLQKTSISLEERMKRTVIATEAILHSRALRIQEKGMAETISSLKEWERFRSAAQGLPDTGSLWLLDNQANLLMDSTEYPSRRMNFSEREYFAPQRDSGIELYIGPVVKGKITNKYSFTISHRINGRDGSFLGIVLAAIETDDYTNFLSNINIGENSTVTVFRTDGAMILRQPMQDEYLGKTFKHLKLFSMPFNEVTSGIYETDAIDGIKRLIAYRKVQGFPLLVATGVPVGSVLKEWRARVKVYSLIAAIAFLALMGLSWLAHRITSREEKEKAKELFESNLSLQAEIVEREHSQLALRKSEQRWATTLASIGDAVIASDAAGSITFMNNVAEELTGWTLPEASTKLVAEIFNIINEQTRSQVENPVTKVLREGMIVSLANHTILVRKDGTEVPIDDSGAPIRDASGKTVGVVLVFRDITERREAVDKLRKARDELEHQVEMRTNQLRQQAELLELAHDAIILTDKDGIIIFWSTGAGRTYGFSKEEAIGNITHNLLQTKSDIPAKDILGIVEREGRWEGELVHTCKEGREVIVHSRWALRLNEVSGKQEIMEVNRDISERKRVERALMESEERYRVAIESASDGIAIVKGDEHIYVNARFAEMFGYKDANEVIGKPLIQTVHPDDLKMVSEINRMRQMGEPVPIRYEFRGIKKDGSIRYIEVSAARTHYQREPVSLAYLRDITDYKNLETQLRHSQKMEAIGTLAGGIAHDFNNILAAIIGFSEMVEEDIPLGKPSVQHVQRVINAAYRGRELVQQILAFSRKTEYARHPVSLFSIVKETIQLMRATIPATIDILLESDPPTSDTILATPVEVQQILMNLVTNASLAMQQHGGVLHVSIADVKLEPDSPVLRADMAPGEYIQLVVSDTGTGITPDVKDRIFEPFFTTREVGQGTGMGLAVVYGIVENLHGNIQVESEPGVGTTINVLFPTVKSDAIAETLSTEQSPGKRERVLFIDDEEFLVEWGQSLLERLGYEVTAMNNSTEAFEAFTSDPSRFDLVITDQTMPGITGLNLARELLKIRPDIPVILCSGHSDAVTLDTIKEAGVREFLMKPLARQELAEIIRRVLDKEMET